MLREGVKNTYIYNIVIWLYGLRSQKSGVTEWSGWTPQTAMSTTPTTAATLLNNA